MRPALLLTGGLAALVVAGCGGGSPSNDVPETRLEVTSSPENPYAGDPVTITAGAHNDQVKLRTLTIDFTDDGVWDDTRTFDARAIAESFTYVYADRGTYSVNVEVTDKTGKAVSGKAEVTVATPLPKVPVFFVMSGVSPQGGSCYAADPPGTCDGCTVLVGSSTPVEETRSLGQAKHGAHVLVDQAFDQWPVIRGRETYSCQFLVHIFAGNPGSERSIGGGACETSSQSSPAVLECRIAAAGTVP